MALDARLAVGEEVVGARELADDRVPVGRRARQQLVGRVVLVVALQAPLAGVVYVLDGILIGAGDARYLALAGAVSLALYLPFALLVRHVGVGLVWVWASYAVFMTARALTLGLRARGDAWVRTGT